MKRILIIFGALILIFVGIIGYTLSYPQTIINNPASDIIYDENYFITRFTLENIQLLKENSFIISKDELNGFINYQFENKGVSFDSGPFKTTNLTVDLLEDGLVLNIYGRLYALPTRIQARLKPTYKEGKIYFAVEELNFPRLNIPKRYFSKFVGNALGMSSPLEEHSNFVIPLDFHEMVIINDVEFHTKGVIILYQLDREKLLEEMLKEFRGRIGF